jgi:alkylation response protein AidB-like acyl-CoA dehydrogenase
MATDEQRELVERVHNLCEQELSFEKVKALEKANDGVGGYPWEIHHKFAEAGFYSMNLPKELGGQGFNFVTRGLVMEEIASYDLGFAFSFRGLGEKFPSVMNSHIPQAEKNNWIHRQITEHIGGVFCLTEPSAGSDAKMIETTAHKEGGEWVINGTKSMVTNGGTGEYFTIFAWTDKTVSPGKGITAFLVYKGTPGFTTTKPEEYMGMKLCNITGLELKDVHVPNERIVGEEGRAFATAMGTLEAVRPYNVCFTVGAAQRAIDIAKDFANERKTFGKYIIDHQGVGFQLAELQMKVDAARAMAYYALEAADRGIPLGHIGSATKGMGIKLCVEAANDVLELMGSYGYSKDYMVEKIIRDIRGYAIAGGTYNIMKEVVCRYMKVKR